MSGGSFNYLYQKEVTDFIEGQGVEDIKDMAEELEDIGFQMLARETLAIYKDIQKFSQEFERRIADISPVWKAIEWWRSADSGFNGVQIAVDKYERDNEKAVLQKVTASSVRRMSDDVCRRNELLNKILFAILNKVENKDSSYTVFMNKDLYSIYDKDVIVKELHKREFGAYEFDEGDYWRIKIYW